MRMKQEHYRRLHEISQLTHLSPRSDLILARRIARQAFAEKELIQARFTAEIAKAESGIPFTKARLASLKEAQRAWRNSFTDGILAIGGWLSKYDEMLTERYGFDGICDVLEVNPVHRPDVLELADGKGRAVSAVAFVCGFEDSAAYQSGRSSSDYKEGPLFKVFLEMTLDLTRRRADLMPDPFEPGGPLYGAPIFHKQPDGTLARQSASLVVHDAKGRRVVKRKIEAGK